MGNSLKRSYESSSSLFFEYTFNINSIQINIIKIKDDFFDFY